jgi:hypothetical protein
VNDKADPIIQAIDAAETIVLEPIDLKEAGLSQRDALLAVCDGIEVWRADDGEIYATVPVGDHV